MTLFEPEHKPPEPTEADTAHAVVDTALATIPGLGAIASRLFGHIFAPPLERRRREWMEDVAGALRRLEARSDVLLDSLGENEAFIDTVFQATQAAMSTSQHEKRLALRNAVLNAALPGAPDAALQQVFLNLVDSFTDWHLLLLRLFDDPVAWWKREKLRPLNAHFGAALAQVVETAFPELRNRRDFYDQVWKDLNDRGLVATPDLHTMMTEQGVFTSRTTPLGIQFLAFIREP
jgi:hypothetical protein